MKDIDLVFRVCLNLLQFVVITIRLIDGPYYSKIYIVTCVQRRSCDEVIQQGVGHCVEGLPTWVDKYEFQGLSSYIHM